MRQEWVREQGRQVLLPKVGERLPVAQPDGAGVCAACWRVLPLERFRGWAKGRPGHLHAFCDSCRRSFRRRKASKGVHPEALAKQRD